MSTAYENGKKLLCGDYTSYTPSGKSLFVREKRSNKIPERGAVIYFYTSSLDRVSHVGIVENMKVIDGFNGIYQITTIEGNTAAGKTFERDGGEVAEKLYTFTLGDVGGKNRINCFCYPKFGDDTCTVDEFIAEAKSWLGYVEKESNGTDEELKDKLWNPGDQNYTWFGKWYGMNPAQWCQMFVSYCAYAACKTHKEARKDGWFLEDGKWYYYQNGVMLKDQWLELDGKWYVLSGDGHALTNEWFGSNGYWYYFGDDSAMYTSQWLKDQDDWYYFASTGIMITTAYTYAPDRAEFCYCNKGGKWDGKYLTWNELDGSIEILK